jgi:hypothetical protein
LSLPAKLCKAVCGGPGSTPILRAHLVHAPTSRRPALLLTVQTIQCSPCLSHASLHDSRGPVAYSLRQPSPPPLIHFYGRLHTESLILRLSIFSFLEAATVLGCRESGLFCELPSNSDGGSPVSEKSSFWRLGE